MGKDMVCRDSELSDLIHGFCMHPEDWMMRDNARGIKKNNFCIEAINKDFKPRNIEFNPDYTNFGLLMSYGTNGKAIECALLGFNIDDVFLSILQVQGARKAYMPLTICRWEAALFEAIKKFSVLAGTRMITSLRGRDVEGWNPEIDDKLRLRYDIAAFNAGFELDDDMGKYVWTG